MLAKAWSFADRLADTCGDRWLRGGLVAVSIDDNGTDFRDSYVALGDLYIGGPMRHGTGPYFEEAAEISSGTFRTSNKPRCGISCSASKDRRTSRPSHRTGAGQGVPLLVLKLGGETRVPQ